ncbi:unnamed protein product [Ceutorhynchus assimilis]|uniref:MD-2-related lipid-recognition domain-containing protein n=1 Tax=Ceutorhynchus assimilis TaxID=467358 RepID=A0A9N9QKZ6_9CUCU|nr:unnamed protein product [Ceutorhynchus assimilis]
MHCSLLVFTIFISSAVVCSATKVKQCPNGNIKNLEEYIIIDKCEIPPCKLRRNTKLPLTFKFVAEDEYKSLTQTVYAVIAELKLPFLGEDGEEVCDRIFEEDGVTKNNCKFVKGRIYTYKHDIAVLPVYPKVRTVVHWDITDPTTGKHAVCFETPANIV